MSMYVLVLALWSIETPSVTAQETPGEIISRESRIKAAYLYQFGRYVNWPANASANSQTPFVIGVLGEDPVVANLDQVAELKKVQDQPIQIQRFPSPEQIQPCQILFLSASLPPETQAEVIRRMAGKNILLVGDAEGFLDWGGVVRFVIEDNKVRLYIARKAAEREGLMISAKLLQVAHVVD